LIDWIFICSNDNFNLVNTECSFGESSALNVPKKWGHAKEESQRKRWRVQSQSDFCIFL